MASKVTQIPNQFGLENLFLSEVLRWRYAKSLSISLVLQLFVSTLFCGIYHTIIIEGIWNPFSWLSLLFNGITKPLWLMQLPLHIIYFVILTRIHIQSYTVYWWVPEQRIRYLTNAMQPKKFLYLILYILISCFMLHHYASLLLPDSITLTKQCENINYGLCVNHSTMMLLWAGVLFGCQFAYKYFVSNYRVIRFLPTQRSIIVSLKTKLRIRTLLEACSLYDIGFGFIFITISSYLLLGMTDFWSRILFLSPNPYSLLFEILTVILDIRQLFTLIFCLCLLVYNFHSFFVIFNEIVSQKIELPISCEESEDNVTETAPNLRSWTLPKAMVSSCKLLQLLAFKHLKDFSEDTTPWGHYYRAQVFSISQPGSHPRNWQSILRPSLELIKNFTDKLKAVNSTEENPVTAASSQLPMDVNKNVTKMPSLNLKKKCCDFLQGFKQYPIFYYLLFDLPDSKNRQIFAESQSVIWAVQGLSNLTAASYYDDHYGVVQRNVGEILTTLTQLQQVVDKVGRGITTRRTAIGNNYYGSKNQKLPHDLQLRRSLRLTIRSAIYVITNTFNGAIRDLALADDVRTKMESYLSFQE